MVDTLLSTVGTTIEVVAASDPSSTRAGASLGVATLTDAGALEEPDDPVTAGTPTMPPTAAANPAASTTIVRAPPDDAVEAARSATGPVTVYATWAALAWRPVRGRRHAGRPARRPLPPAAPLEAPVGSGAESFLPGRANARKPKGIAMTPATASRTQREAAPQRRLGAVHARPGVVLRDAELLSDLGIGEAVHLVEPERLTLRGGERVQGVLHRAQHERVAGVLGDVGSGRLARADPLGQRTLHLTSRPRDRCTRSRGCD